MSRASQVSARPSHVRERLIGALIADALGPSDETARVPLPVLPTLRRLGNLHPATLLVSTSRMDRSGRVHERILLRELGWNPGGRVDMDTIHGMILIAATPTGQHTIDHRGAIKLPASLRRLAVDRVRPSPRTCRGGTRTGDGHSPLLHRRPPTRQPLHRPHPDRPGPRRS